ncbi:MAG: L-seryl-tRNA(Sec) selenium transferase, partial [Bryobacteraceae bacterium]
LVPGRSVVGGGSTPGQTLPTWLVALNGDAVQAERRLREVEPPVIARIEEGRLVLDLRTVFEEEEQALAAALRRVLS